MERNPKVISNIHLREFLKYLTEIKFLQLMNIQSNLIKILVVTLREIYQTFQK